MSAFAKIMAIGVIVAAVLLTFPPASARAGDYFESCATEYYHLEKCDWDLILPPSVRQITLRVDQDGTNATPRTVQVFEGGVHLICSKAFAPSDPPIEIPCNVSPPPPDLTITAPSDGSTITHFAIHF